MNHQLCKENYHRGLQNGQLLDEADLIPTPSGTNLPKSICLYVDHRFTGHYSIVLNDQILQIIQVCLQHLLNSFLLEEKVFPLQSGLLSKLN